MENRPRRHVESDTFSFYFKAPSSQQHGQSFTRGHRHRDSNMSVSSQAPPINLYNHSFGTHRRNDSSVSSSSVVMSYARHSANSGMVAWTRHRREISIDSVMSDLEKEDDTVISVSSIPLLFAGYRVNWDIDIYYRCLEDTFVVDPFDLLLKHHLASALKNGSILLPTGFKHITAKTTPTILPTRLEL